MPSGKPGTRKPKPPDLREKPAQGKPLDGGKNPGGRPEEWIPEKISELGESLIQWARNPEAKYLATFCAENGTYPQKLSEFAKKDEKFSESLKIAKACCEAHIAELTGLGMIPTAFGVFALKQHEWTDKAKVDFGGSVEQKHTGTIAHTFDTTKIADLLNGSAN
jgi:hypothetical protein